MHRIEPRRSALVAANLLIQVLGEMPVLECSQSGCDRALA
ncbi:hypothetical protein USDA257_c15460 [Sinorhizobium fredii USDA 257]|uniref:Uncharacterized protein n=1 Tax=Sinorhizobium fredii (strain USDA 257) TaxID=1185652 RepID=I3X2N0_SINF2|nr:hypothetical protein USDA257_c15460 [Sinorhizobium fredii USDA 257]